VNIVVKIFHQIAKDKNIVALLTKRERMKREKE
jgi:hypothetical protein